MKLPFVLRRAHESEVEHLKGVIARDRVEPLMRAMYLWLMDSQAKSRMLRARLYGDAPETFNIGWDAGQQWINDAIENIRQNYFSTKENERDKIEGDKKDA